MHLLIKWFLCIQKETLASAILADVQAEALSNRPQR